MLRNAVKKVVVLGSAAAALATQASAAVTFDTTTAETDIGTVFAGIVTVGVLMFGFRKIRSMLKA